MLKKESEIKSDPKWTKDKYGLSNNIYYKDDLICKFFIKNEFSNYFGNQEILILKEIKLFDNLESGKDFFCTTKFDCKVFNTETLNKNQLDLIAKKISEIHKIKILKNTKVKAPNFIETWNFLNLQPKVFKYSNEDKILKNALEILDKDLVYANNDIVDGNILFLKNNTVKIIDYEYGGINSKYFDIASFIVKRKLSKKDEQVFLNFYIKYQNQKFDFDKFEIARKFTAVFWSKWARYRFQISNNLIYDEISKWLILRSK